jgi:hypothetical protein
MSANYGLRRKVFGSLIIFYRLSGVASFFLLFSILGAIPGFAAAQPASQQLSETERWVLSQVREGREADLERKYAGNPEMQRLRAAFLEKLILGGFSNYRIPHRGIQIAHARIDEPLNLEYIEVDHPLSLSNCLFRKAVTFQESHFKKDLTLSGCKFLQAANFKGIKVGGNVFCNDAVFEQESLWSDAKIGEKFHALRAGFRSSEAKADFNAMKIGANAFFTSATFYGPVDFGLVHIGRQFNINKAEFFHKRETVNFISAKVEQIAYFKQVRFHGPVDFAIAQIGIQFNADEAEFFCPDQLANFSGMKVGNTIFFQRAKFHGPVKFEFAEIGVNFRGTGAAFANAGQTKNFSKMKVNQKVLLDKTVMAGKFDMSYGGFYDLDIQGLVRDDKGRPELMANLSLLNLKGTLVQRELKIANVGMGELDASNLQVKGPTQFINVDIKTRADFSNSNFQGLDFQDTKWPDKDKKSNTRKVYLNDMSYTSISIDKQENSDYDEKDFLKVKDFVEATPLNTQSYIQLEAFFKRIGKDQWANEIFIRMHDRELAEKMAWWDPRRWLEWFFWGVLAGYGRAPFRVLFVSVLLIILGALIYNPKYLQEDVRSPEGKAYKSIILRCFLSLDRFLPLDLGLGKHWDTRTSHFLIWFYFYFQLILGWILIPIVLASIYTQIK